MGTWEFQGSQGTCHQAVILHLTDGDMTCQDYTIIRESRGESNPKPKGISGRPVYDSAEPGFIHLRYAQCHTYLLSRSFFSYGARASTLSPIPSHWGSVTLMAQGEKNLGSHRGGGGSLSRKTNPTSKIHETNQWTESPGVCPSPRIPEPSEESF